MEEKSDSLVNPFLTVDEKGNPVEMRVTCPASMRSIFDRFCEEDREEADRRVRLMNIYNGNLPYDPAKLRQLNLANLTNFNSGDLRGFIDARVGVIADLALDTCPLVELRPWPANMAGAQAATYAEVIAEEFSSTVRDGNQLLPCLATMFRECDLFGIGPVTWESPREYTPVALRRGQIKFRMDGPVISSKHEIFMFESPATVHFFRRLFERPGPAEKEGWNIKAVKQLLVDTYVGERDAESEPGNSTGTSASETALIEMRQNRWTEVNQFKTLNLVHALVKETDGKIRHLICSPDVPLDGGDDFLFNKPGAYDSMDQCLLWMPASVVETEARGSRGVASMVGPLADVNNRLLCQTYDAAFRVGSLVLTSKSPSQQHQHSIVERGPYTLLAGDLVPAQTQMSSPNVQMLSALREIGTNIGYNNAVGTRGVLGTLPERMASGSDRKTKEEVLREEQNRSRGEQQLFAARTIVLDLIFRETFRRFGLLVSASAADRKDHPEIEAFRKRCILRGVPEEALENMTDLFGVYVNRILVTGGGQAQAATLSQLLGAFGGAFDEQGRVLVLRDIVRFRLGQKCADRYRPEESRDTAASNAASFAVLENGAMRDGSQAVVGFDQLHWSHIPVHMQLIGIFVQQYREDPQAIQDPQRMLDVMAAASQHIQQHIHFGGQQPGVKDAVKQVMSQLSSLAPIIKGLTMMAGTLERQRQAEAERQQKQIEEMQKKAEGQEAAVAMHDSDNKAQLKAREQDLMHQVRLQKVQQDGEIALIKAGNEAKARIAKGTARFEQGADIMGIGNGPEFPGAGMVPDDGALEAPLPAEEMLQ